jgi:hypothetical protein
VASFEFGEAPVSGGSHHRWRRRGLEALYTLEPQPDGSVKITGCVLVIAAGRAV